LKSSVRNGESRSMLDFSSRVGMMSEWHQCHPVGPRRCIRSLLLLTYHTYKSKVFRRRLNLLNVNQERNISTQRDRIIPS